MNHDEHHHDRLAELLAAAQLNDLSPDEQTELDELLLNATEQDQDAPQILGEILVMLDEQQDADDEMPAALRAKLTQGGRAAIATQSPQSSGPIQISQGQSRPSSALGWVAALAAVIAIGSGIFAITTLNAKNASEADFQQRLASLREQVDENQQLLDRARLAAAETANELEQLDTELSDAQARLAANEAEKLDLAQRLADATMNLEDAQLKIAKYEEPTDPAVLAERRQQLLEVPDTVQIAWQPFDLPESPAEQRNVRGDVVWSDELQQGYIRFVGLNPNDPNIEQYQVWVIDERGLEQKVSGGVFNASADGEIIVPIEPGIDVGRVGLFAVTVENPGGTWVPDLERRVVVAPRDG